MKKFLSIILLILLVLTIAMPVYAGNETNSSAKAKVIEIKGIEEVKKENEPTKKVQNATVRILEGEYENEEYEMIYVISEDIEGAISNIELEEDEQILVELEEKEGEITSVKYKETIKQSYILYIATIISILLVLIVSRGKAIGPVIKYLLAIIIICILFIFSIKNGWNLILVSSIVAVLTSMYILIKVNGANKKTLALLLCTILCVNIAGISIYLIFDIMNLTDINVKIAENYTSIKDLVTSGIILVGLAISNAIMISALKINYDTNKPYKTKSDNIIEGQRSLKL